MAQLAHPVALRPRRGRPLGALFAELLDLERSDDWRGEEGRRIFWRHRPAGGLHRSDRRAWT